MRLLIFQVDWLDTTYQLNYTAMCTSLACTKVTGIASIMAYIIVRVMTIRGTGRLRPCFSYVAKLVYVAGRSGQENWMVQDLKD